MHVETNIELVSSELSGEDVGESGRDGSVSEDVAVSGQERTGTLDGTAREAIGKPRKDMVISASSNSYTHFKHRQSRFSWWVF
jgi:hypothetical protein